MTDTLTLWRPTGPDELALVEATGSTRWPPRLPDQPIFYPVMNGEYATRIARDWNVKASGAGYLTRFEVDALFTSGYEVDPVGGDFILGLRAPASELEEFNDHVVGLVEVIAEFW